MVSRAMPLREALSFQALFGPVHLLRLGEKPVTEDESVTTKSHTTELARHG